MNRQLLSLIVLFVNCKRLMTSILTVEYEDKLVLKVSACDTEENGFSICPFGANF